MIEAVLEVYHRLKLAERFEGLPLFGKIVLGSAIVLAFSVIAHFVPIESVPGLDMVQGMFTKASPQAQSVFLLVVFVVCVLLAIFSYERFNKARRLKVELREARAEAEKHQQEAKLLQERWDRLLAVETRERIWQRPCKAIVPPFIGPAQRRTRFVTMLNLKGGVGKTTLTANLAASLALVHQKSVLLVDVDFQGTLSDTTVDQRFVEIQLRNGNTVDKLFTDSFTTDLIKQLTVPMNGVSGVKVILADDRLEMEDYSLQARFFVDPGKEVRYFFRGHLHRQSVIDAFDFVFFDCPPRLTTSSVNALACSDAVIIPTKLDVGSVNAVPRTLDFLSSLSAVVPVGSVSVLATHAAVWRGELTKTDRNGYAYLGSVVAGYVPGQDVVFKAVVPATPKAVASTLGLVASVGEEGREVFRPFVEEFKRMLQH
jgi:cellulose biosynthesis protein BcsQ